MNNSYFFNKSPKIAKGLLVLLDMIVVVLTLALSVSALQRHFWTIGLWRPLASCLAHRPLHRHWFSFVAFPLNIATPEIGGWFVNAVQRQYEVKLASGGGAPLLQCGSSESVDCRPVSEASVSSSVSPVAAYTTGMKSASGHRLQPKECPTCKPSSSSRPSYPMVVDIAVERLLSSGRPQSRSAGCSNWFLATSKFVLTGGVHSDSIKIWIHTFSLYWQWWQLAVLIQ